MPVNTSPVTLLYIGGWMSELDQPWGLPEQQSLPELVEARIVGAIRAGELKAGERIVETLLAKKLNVSRGPLREALRSLEANHLVFTVRGKGTYVAEVSRDDMIRMVGVRAVLEGFAARLVAGRCDREPDVIAQLDASLEALQQAEAGDDAMILRDVDWQFHELVCTLSGNPFLLASWHSISSLVRLYQQSNENYEAHSESIVEHHREFVDSLRTGDSDFAEATFRRIIIESAFAWLQLPVPDAMKSMVDTAVPKRSKRRK
jgi:DNA-binding GntR family transcriptional regulator